MLITCTHCHRQLNLPDEKVPPRAFALACPGCKGRIEVDPTQTEAASATEPAPAEPTPVKPTPAETSDEASHFVASPAPAPLGEVSFEPLPPLRDIDRELLGHLYPMAAIANLAGRATEHQEEGLKLLGMREVRVFSDLEQATEAMLETDYAILLIVLDRATAPPCEPLAPLYKLPVTTRRPTFVALQADNVRSLDGQTAFYLQVNCLLATQDMAQFPGHLQRALLFHLRQYRHWNTQEET